MPNNHAEEKQSSSPDFGPAPDGGVTAWLVAAGGCTVFFCCLGFTNAFGAFEEYYLSHQLSERTPDDVAWIGSLAAFLQFATGMIAGPIFDRFGVNVSEIVLTSRDSGIANFDLGISPCGFGICLCHDDA